MPSLLDLVSETGSIGRAFEARGWEVFCVEVDREARPTICSDVLAWDYGGWASGDVDVIWASHPPPLHSLQLRAHPRRP